VGRTTLPGCLLVTSTGDGGVDVLVDRRRTVGVT